MTLTGWARWLLRGFMALGLVFIYVPLALVLVNSINGDRTFGWPPHDFTLRWWSAAWDNAGARDDCKKAVSLKPDYTDAWETLGRAYEDLGQVDKAEETYKKVLTLDPSNKEAKDGLDFIATCRKPGADCSGSGAAAAPEKKKGK